MRARRGNGVDVARVVPLVPRANASARAAIDQDVARRRCGGARRRSSRTPRSRCIRASSGRRRGAGSEELWQSVVAAGRRGGAARRTGRAVGLANQGGPVLAWDRRRGRPLSAALSWQDRATAACARGSRASHGGSAAITGLPLDPYFAAPKMTWLREHVTRAGVVTTTDAGSCIADGRLRDRRGDRVAHAAARLDRGAWSAEACAPSVDRRALPAIVGCAEPVGRRGLRRPRSGRRGSRSISRRRSSAKGVRAGDAKCTYGTGAFLLATTARGASARDRLAACVAWRLGGARRRTASTARSTRRRGGAVARARRALATRRSSMRRGAWPSPARRRLRAGARGARGAVLAARGAGCFVGLRSRPSGPPRARGARRHRGAGRALAARSRPTSARRSRASASTAASRARACSADAGRPAAAAGSRSIRRRTRPRFGVAALAGSGAAGSRRRARRSDDGRPRPCTSPASRRPRRRSAWRAGVGAAETTSEL
jgi:hypothetical protein